MNIDINDLMNIIKPYMQLSRNGEMIFTDTGESLSMSNKIMLVLIGARLLKMLGIKNNDYLSLHEISSYISSTTKSTSSRLSELNSKGLVEKYRDESGVKYRVSLKGIIYFSRKMV